MLLYGMTILATVPQRSESLDGLMSYPVLVFTVMLDINFVEILIFITKYTYFRAVGIAGRKLILDKIR